MLGRRNPFNEVYVTETIRPDSFTKLFSPLLVEDTLPLFQPGNIVLTGTQGTGKSMLLALLKPQIRIAYYQAGPGKYPIPDDFSHFLGAGINLTRCGATDFGQRPIEEAPDSDDPRLPGYFADFVNYWIVHDILRSIQLLSTELEGRIGAELGLRTDRERLHDFAKVVGEDDCWSGFLAKVKDLSGLMRKITVRLACYRDYLNYNSEDIPKDIRASRTSIGEPISKVAAALWQTRVLPEEVPIFVRIDQHEELLMLEEWSGNQQSYRNYRSVINKLIGKRDPRVSYRVGTRPYAWVRGEDARIYGTKSVVEEMRNYKRIDIDEVLRRRENQKTWLFPEFAQDVFRRRLCYAGFPVKGKRSNYLREVFGYRLDAKEKARIYAGEQPERVLNCPREWPSHLIALFAALARHDPLSAVLGEAWVRQQLRRQNPVLPEEDYFPWETKAKKWWNKERQKHALLQIAARRRQRLIWSGESDILTLSGSNILAFLSICQQIWQAWLRSLPRETPMDESSLPSIRDPYVQTEGIEEASQKWYRKIRQDAGDSLQRFTRVVAEEFRKELRSDESMAYPGHNGFSLLISSLERDDQVARQLERAVAYGVFFDFPHTPKSPASGERRKWYVNPILSPRFQIPASHTKEPMYTTVIVVRKWLERAHVLEHKAPRARVQPNHQLLLFDEREST
jgi:hypothetical protein